MITTPAEFTPFVRRGSRVIPTWFHYEIGDVKYDISSDVFYICLRHCREIGVRMEDASGEPDSGLTAKEQGFKSSNSTDDPGNWGLAPQWLTHLGISANEFSDFVKSRLSRPVHG